MFLLNSKGRNILRNHEWEENANASESFRGMGGFSRRQGNVWRGLLAFAKLRGWVLPAVPSPGEDRSVPTAQPERPLQQTGWIWELLRVEWEEKIQYA